MPSKYNGLQNQISIAFVANPFTGGFFYMPYFDTNIMLALDKIDIDKLEVNNTIKYYPKGSTSQIKQNINLTLDIVASSNSFDKSEDFAFSFYNRNSADFNPDLSKEVLCMVGYGNSIVSIPIQEALKEISA